MRVLRAGRGFEQPLSPVRMNKTIALLFLVSAVVARVGVARRAGVDAAVRAAQADETVWSHHQHSVSTVKFYYIQP